MKMKNIATALLLALLVGCQTQAPDTLIRSGQGEDIAVDWTNANALLSKYEELASGEKRAFKKSLRSTEYLLFTIAYSSKHGGIGGDDLERWGEKCLSEGQRLSSDVIYKHINSKTIPVKWINSYKKYLQIILQQRSKSDAYEIGLTDKDIASLKPIAEELTYIECFQRFSKNKSKLDDFVKALNSPKIPAGRLKSIKSFLKNILNDSKPLTPKDLGYSNQELSDLIQKLQ
jgi:hypothetical protein